ncbi:MAG TPA: hypothetical protein VNA04_16660 [Thermoanaerobaculia bacterium]|nr:hypothetical protein [Thermoanaerobaculia bacterium]
MPAEQIARVVIALAAAVGLALVAAHPAVRRFEQRFGLSVLAASGFPLLILGYAFRNFGVVTEQTLADLRPAYEFGLGWIGLVVGMQLNVRRLDELPHSFTTTLALLTLPATVLVGLSSGLLLAIFGLTHGTGLLRDVLILSACAAVSAPANLRLLLRNAPSRSTQIVSAVTQIDQVAAFAILALVASMFRPQATVLWRLPRSGWFIVTAGVGFLLGVVIYLLLRNVRNRTEEVSLLIGGIALAAGTAGYLALSVPVVCALAGAVLANVPYRHKARLEATLGDFERPMYLLFLFLVGTTWRPLEWQGWALGVLFAVTRGYGKLVGARAAVRVAPADLPSARNLTLAVLPESAVAIVVIFSLATLDPEPVPGIAWGINAVIIGSVLTEVFVQAMQRREARAVGEETGRAVTHFV